MPKYCQIIVEQIAREHGVHSDSTATETQIEGIVKDTVAEYWLYGPEDLKLFMDVFPHYIYTRFIEPFMPKNIIIVREEHTAKRSDVDEHEWTKSLNKLATTTLRKLYSAIERR